MTLLDGRPTPLRVSKRVYDPPQDNNQPVVMHILEAVAGGTSRHLIDLVRHTRNVRHVVVVPQERVGAVPDRLALPALREAGAHVHLVEMRRMPLHPVNLRAVLRIMRLIRDTRPDVIHGHSAIGGALARVVPASPRIRRVYTPNGLNQNRYALRIERRLTRRTDRVVAVSPSEAGLLGDLGLVSDERLRVIPNAIEIEPEPTDTVNLRQMLGLPQDALLVGSVARLLPQKAPERFVECCRQVAKAHPDANFVLIGDGPLAAAVDGLASVPELAGRFTRLAELQGAAPVLAQLDVFVLLSRFEGGPYSPLEAMRGGTPVVLSDAVGNVDVLEGDLSQLLIPGGDPGRAAAMIVRLLDDPALRDSLSARVQRRVREAFDVRMMGDAYTEFYTELVKPAPAPRRSMDSAVTLATGTARVSFTKGQRDGRRARDEIACALGDG